MRPYHWISMHHAVFVRRFMNHLERATSLRHQKSFYKYETRRRPEASFLPITLRSRVSAVRATRTG